MTPASRILSALGEGDPLAANELLPLVYDELRRLAAQQLAQEKPGQTLQATALVHEAYVRLVGAGQDRAWHNRKHFFAAAAEAMRRILIENVRRKRSLKRVGGGARLDLEEVQLAAPEPIEDLPALAESLDRLAAQDAVKAELVKLRYFVGMTLQEAADILGISVATAKRYWRYARAWLYNDIARESGQPRPDEKRQLE